MDLPFTTEQFLGVFRDYNLTVWPAQIAVLLVATWCIARALSGPAGSRLTSALLASLWLWMGIVYHGIFFTRVNPAAWAFAALFIIEGLLIVRAGALRGTLRFHPQSDLAGIAGGVLMAYGLLVYPLLGAASGHSYPQSPTFGLPCPTTIFTLGIFLWADPPMPRHLLVIPVLWAIIGSSSAFLSGMTEDIGLIVAALVAIVLLIRRPSTQATIAHS